MHGAGSGIIPTRVGTSYLWHSINKCKWDHPHACGDKQVQNYEKNGEKGSSPRVWGQVLKKSNDIIYKRIIPTRVGTRLL